MFGKTYYSTDAKTKMSGTKTNQSAKTAALNCGGSYTIPAGYHNGNGKITANTLSAQTSGTATAANEKCSATEDGTPIIGFVVAPYKSIEMLEAVRQQYDQDQTVIGEALQAIIDNNYRLSVVELGL